LECILGANLNINENFASHAYLFILFFLVNNNNCYFFVKKKKLLVNIRERERERERERDLTPFKMLFHLVFKFM